MRLQRWKVLMRLVPHTLTLPTFKCQMRQWVTRTFPLLHHQRFVRRR